MEKNIATTKGHTITLGPSGAAQDEERQADEYFDKRELAGRYYVNTYVSNKDAGGANPV